MYTKIIFASVLIAFIGFQLATSLECYTCSDPGTCKKLIKQTCNNSTANATSSALSIYHLNVAAVNGSKTFECIRNIWTASNKTVLNAVYGCAHPTVQTCSLSLRPEYAVGNWHRDCIRCSGNLCNPAGTFSSSMYTILASVVGLIFAKSFA